MKKFKETVAYWCEDFLEGAEIAWRIGVVMSIPLAVVFLFAVATNYVLKDTAYEIVNVNGCDYIVWGGSAGVHKADCTNWVGHLAIPATYSHITNWPMSKMIETDNREYR